MAFAASSISMVCANSRMAFQCFPSPSSDNLTSFSFHTPLSLPRPRNLTSSIAAASSRKKKTKKLSQNHVKVEDEEEDAFELLFKQLEEDLKNDDLSFSDGDDEITEEDLVKLEQELADALREDDEETFNAVLSDTETDTITEDGVLNDTETGGDSNEEEEDADVDADDREGDARLVNLRSWQLRKLAKALKAGRRKTSIKSLAAELCLDRAIVLELLREPPPDLLMMSLSVADEPRVPVVDSEPRPLETVLEEIGTDQEEPESKSNNAPVHVVQRRWCAQKRLKRAHIDTLERIYRRTKRPTNAMISSIVHVTNLPRRRIVKWFEDKRADDGVPDDRVPYRRSVA